MRNKVETLMSSTSQLLKEKFKFREDEYNAKVKHFAAIEWPDDNEDVPFEQAFVRFAKVCKQLVREENARLEPILTQLLGAVTVLEHPDFDELHCECGYYGDEDCPHTCIRCWRDEALANLKKELGK